MWKFKQSQACHHGRLGLIPGLCVCVCVCACVHVCVCVCVQGAVGQFLVE